MDFPDISKTQTEWNGIERNVGKSEVQTCFLLFSATKAVFDSAASVAHILALQ